MAPPLRAGHAQTTAVTKEGLVPPPEPQQASQMAQARPMRGGVAPLAVAAREPCPGSNDEGGAGGDATATGSPAWAAANAVTTVCSATAACLAAATTMQTSVASIGKNGACAASVGSGEALGVTAAMTSAGSRRCAGNPNASGCGEGLAQMEEGGCHGWRGTNRFNTTFWQGTRRRDAVACWAQWGPRGTRDRHAALSVIRPEGRAFLTPCLTISWGSAHYIVVNSCPRFNYRDA